KDDEGEVISESAIGNRYGFTGREYDGETGLYHYRARSYNPEVGRFMQHDPLKIYDENAYSYCYNDPLNWVDPSGLQVLDPGVLFGIIQGGGVIIQIIPSGIVVGNVHSGSTGGTDLFSVPATTDDEDDPPPTDVRPNDAEKEKERIKPKAGGKAARRGESAKGGTRTQAVGVSGQVTNAAARGGNKGKKLRELRKRLKTLWDHWQKYRNPRDPYEKALMRRQIRKMIREIRKRFPKPIWGIFK
ncbi:MAG: RHS repeat-associated core domain-containing protein, partial [Candidatus Omnitrophica bacterium]|nr:RHS repeat-associated core domain-containing protein [Candidatus Omnitrophota bacterium]